MQHREALQHLVQALRDRHYGRMPDEVQRAYDGAIAALASVPAAEPVLHALVRSNGTGFVTYDGTPIVSESPVKPFEAGQQQVQLYTHPQAQRAPYGSIAERAQAGLDAGWWKPEGAALAAKSLRRSAAIVLDMVAAVEKAVEAQPELRAEATGHIATMRAEADHLTAAARLLAAVPPPEQEGNQ